MAPSVAIVGGGIIRCAIAYELAKAGCRVTVVAASPSLEHHGGFALSCFGHASLLS